MHRSLFSIVVTASLLAFSGCASFCCDSGCGSSCGLRSGTWQDGVGEGCDQWMDCTDAAIDGACEQGRRVRGLLQESARASCQKLNQLNSDCGNCGQCRGCQPVRQCSHSCPPSGCNPCASRSQICPPQRPCNLDWMTKFKSHFSGCSKNKSCSTGKSGCGVEGCGESGVPCESCQAALDQEGMGDLSSDSGSHSIESAEQMADETGYSRTTDQGSEFNQAWSMDPSQSSSVATQEIPPEVWRSSGEYFSPPAGAYPESGSPAVGPMFTEVPGQPVYTQAPLNQPLPAQSVFPQTLPNQHFSTAPRYQDAVLPPSYVQAPVQALPPPLPENPPQSLKWRAVSQYRETFPAPPAADIEIEDALPATAPAILPESGQGGKADEFHPPIIINRN